MWQVSVPLLDRFELSHHWRRGESLTPVVQYSIAFSPVSALSEAAALSQMLGDAIRASPSNCKAIYTLRMYRLNSTIERLRNTSYIKSKETLVSSRCIRLTLLFATIMTLISIVSLNTL